MTGDRFANIVPAWESHLPNSSVWDDALHTLSKRLDRSETLAWGRNQLSSPSVRLRQFASMLLLTLSFDTDAVDPELIETLRLRLSVEDDPIELDQIIGAFAEYSTPWDTEAPVDLREILPFAGHVEPGIRRRVADELIRATGVPRPDGEYTTTLAPSDPRAEVVVVLAGLAEDGDAEVRTAALRTLAECGIDLPRVRDALAAHLPDEHYGAQLEAAAGLALRDDPAGRDALARMSVDAEYGSDVWFRIDDVKRTMAHRADT